MDTLLVEARALKRSSLAVMFLASLACAGGGSSSSSQPAEAVEATTSAATAKPLAGDFHLRSGQLMPTTRPSRPKRIGITNNYFIFDVSLVCDSATVAALGSPTVAEFEMLRTFADNDRLFANTDFFLGQTLRLRMLETNCFTSAAGDPFPGVDWLSAVTSYRQSLPPARAGAITHALLWGGGLHGHAWVGAVGNSSAASWSNSVAAGDFTVMAHELGHNFGAWHDGEAGSPCESTPDGWVMGTGTGGTQFSECSRMSIGNYVATLDPSIYEISTDSPPLADAGPDLQVYGTQTAHLRGTGSSDREGIASYFWEPDGVCNSSFPGFPGSANVDVTINDNPPSPAGYRDCRFLLTVTDTAGQVAYDSVRVRQFTRPMPTVLTGTVVPGALAMVSLGWTAVPQATSYTVYRRNGLTGNWAAVYTTSGLAYGDTSVVRGQTYSYTVTASNAAGTSDACSPAILTVPGNPTTTIRFHYDVGVGNRITIRGSTSPLSWTTGQATTWTTGNVWTWSTTAIPQGVSFQYKPLINDVTYSDGANYVGNGGATLDMYPKFNGR